jgi:hypothetical protein
MVSPSLSAQPQWLPQLGACPGETGLPCTVDTFHGVTQAKPIAFDAVETLHGVLICTGFDLYRFWLAL